MLPVECIDGFCVDFKRNNDYFPAQLERIELYALPRGIVFTER